MSDTNTAAAIVDQQAPVVVEEPKATETPAEAAAQPAEQAEDSTEKRQSGAEKRINRLIRERAELRAKAEYLERALQDRTPKAEGSESKEVDIDELVNRKFAERERQGQVKSIEAKRDDIFAKAAKDGDFDAEDFLESTTITPVMAEAILDSDLAPKVVKFLYKNPEEAERIAELSPARQAVEIGKLEAKLSAAPAPAKKSGAPAPISPMAGKTVTQNEYRADMSDAEYAKWRKSK